MKYFKKIYPFIILIGLIYLFTTFEDCGHKKFCENFKKEKYCGRVIKKYINTEQHNYKTVVFRKGKEIDSMFLNTDFSHFYKVVEVNDSIEKIENSREIRIINKDTSFFLTFWCE